MNLDPDLWITDDSHPAKAGLYFTMSKGQIRITPYSKRSYWGEVREIEGWYPCNLSPAFTNLGKQLQKKRHDEIMAADTIVIVGDDGKPL